jgi:hypothetical protein
MVTILKIMKKAIRCSAGLKVANIIHKLNIMQFKDESILSEIRQDNENQLPKNTEEMDVSGPDPEDTDPPLDEEDLEENDLTVEEADQIEWDAPNTGSSGSEEKDFTD